MRLAYFSPVAPVRSGIADYSDALLPYLARYAEIELFVDGYQPTNDETPAAAAIRDWREFEPAYRDGRFDAVLYHIGNNPYHAYVYDLALRFPGVIVLHEFNVHYLLAEVTIARGDWEGYLAELEYNGGGEAREHGERARRGEVQPEYDRIAMNRRLIHTSLGVIVHSEFMARLVRDAGFDVPMARIPHGVSPESRDGSAVRERLGLNGHLLAGSFGFLKPYKRIHSVLRGFARLKDEFPDAHLLLAGEEHPHYPLRPVIEQLGLNERVHLPGYLPLDDFADGIAACDICVNLRFPTVGESSGSLLREMAAGKPVLVSDIGSFAELPPDACLKLPAGEREADWVAEYLAVLFANRELREAVGGRAREWAIEECSWEKVASRYADFLPAVAHTPHRISHRDQAVEAPAASETSTQSARASDEVFVIPASPHPVNCFDRQELAGYVLSWGAVSPAAEAYVRLHLNRLVYTLEITPPARPDQGRDNVLEMGCYMQMTPALARFLRYRNVRGCYYGQAGVSEHKTVSSGTGETFSCVIDLFDAEKDPYPYEAEQFDTVLCCELIEHLYFDPMHMMAEINRVLKPGGHVVLTTPNITSIRALHALLHGYHPGLFHTYVVPDANGHVDPRHNREYAPRDVKALLESAGFELVRLETGWYEENGAARFEDLDHLLSQHDFLRVLRGDIIYAVGKKTGPVRSRYPVELFTSF